MLAPAPAPRMSDRLVVLDMDSDTVSVIDPETGKTETTVETDFNPHEVVVTPDGQKAYVSCSLGGVVDVLDTDTWEITARIEHEAFDFPHGLAVRGDELYLAATRSEKLFVLDWRADEVLEVVDSTQALSHMVSLVPGEPRAFVANIGSDSVSVFDTEARAFTDTIPVGGGPEGIAVHPDGDHLYVANQEDDDLYVLDTGSYEVLHERPLGTTPVRIVFSPDGEYAFVPNREGYTLSVVAHEFDRGGEVVPWEVKRLPVGVWPGGTVFDPDGETAYVANNKTNDVSVVDVEGLEETRRIDAGLHPDGIAYLSR